MHIINCKEASQDMILEFITEAIRTPIPENHYRRIGIINPGNSKRWIHVKPSLDPEAIKQLAVFALEIVWADKQYVEKKKTLAERIDKLERMVEKVLDVLEQNETESDE